jgi:hypothetical protein
MDLLEVVEEVYSQLDVVRRRGRRVAIAIELGDDEYRLVAPRETMYGIPVRHVPGAGVTVVSEPLPFSS